VLEEAVERDPAVWQAHYHLACFDALEGRRDSALERLAHAIELEPEAARWAAEDSDFDAVRDDPRFPTPES
jgi:Tfp pilus assembly protein PilF